VFKPQLRALLRAAALGNVHVMLPMVDDLDEIRRVKALLATCAQELNQEGAAYAMPKLGIMAPPSLSVQIAQESQNPFWHYFGWGCRPKERCIDQLVITMPFYASVAYSLGARLSFARQAKESPGEPDDT